MKKSNHWKPHQSSINENGLCTRDLSIKGETASISGEFELSSSDYIFDKLKPTLYVTIILITEQPCHPGRHKAISWKGEKYTEPQKYQSQAAEELGSWRIQSLRVGSTLIHMKVVSTLALRYNESVPSKASFRGGHQMRGQVRREVVAVELDVHEVHGQGELVWIQHPVPAHMVSNQNYTNPHKNIYLQNIWN